MLKLPFEDTITIKNIWECKGLSAEKLLKKISNKLKKKKTFNVRRLRTTGLTESTAKRGRPAYRFYFYIVLFYQIMCRRSL